VRREATIIRSTTSRRSGTSTQALLIQRFKATRLTGHGAGSRPQYNGGSTGRHGSKATHALSSQQAVKPTKPPPVQSTGGSLARRRPARPNHACVNPFRGQLYSEGNVGATLSNRSRARHMLLSCFPSHVRLLGQNFTRDIHGTGGTTMTCLQGRRFYEDVHSSQSIRRDMQRDRVHLVCETSYLVPATRATKGRWIRISRVTYTGPGQR